MKTKRISLLTLTGIVILAGLVAAGPLAAAQDKGRSMIEMYGGEKDGPVKFDHHKHQKRISNCQVCHKTFAQKPGAIEAAKKSGALTKKKVMNKTCLKCHRTKKADGSRTGPFKCKDCHIKP